MHLVDVAAFDFRFQAQQPMRMPGYMGTAWRGGFGRALRRAACITGLPGLSRLPVSHGLRLSVHLRDAARNRGAGGREKEGEGVHFQEHSRRPPGRYTAATTELHDHYIAASNSPPAPPSPRKTNRNPAPPAPTRRSFGSPHPPRAFVQQGGALTEPPRLTAPWPPAIVPLSEPADPAGLPKPTPPPAGGARLRAAPSGGGRGRATLGDANGSRWVGITPFPSCQPLAPAPRSPTAPASPPAEHRGRRAALRPLPATPPRRSQPAGASIVPGPIRPPSKRRR